jgi:hypothetical protein
MRTTVTLDADTAALVQQDMRQRGVSFKQALNDAVRAGLAPPPTDEAPTAARARSMGTPTVELTKALQVAASLEDEEITRDLIVGR